MRLIVDRTAQEIEGERAGDATGDRGENAPTETPASPTLRDWLLKAADEIRKSLRPPAVPDAAGNDASQIGSSFVETLNRLLDEDAESPAISEFPGNSRPAAASPLAAGWMRYLGIEDACCDEPKRLMLIALAQRLHRRDALDAAACTDPYLAVRLAAQSALDAIGAG